MNILVIGGGGREHALVWKLSQSTLTNKVYAAPGNPGMAEVGECLNPASSTPEGFVQIAREKGIDLTVVGPEAPLVDGVVDSFRAEGLRIVGPVAAAAQLEGSKVFAKRFMDEAGVPTARFKSVDRVQDIPSVAGELSFRALIGWL